MRSMLMFALSMVVIANSPPTLPAQQAADGTDEIVVKLISPGENPRQAIRFNAKKGDKQSAVMTMKMSQSMVFGGQKLPPVPTPAMQFTIDVGVTDVAANGDLSFAYTYTHANVLDDGEASPTKEAVESMIKSLEGLKGTGVISNRGFTKSSDIELPEDIAPQVAMVIKSMEGSLSKMSSPLPEEPIGIGGQWSVTQSTNANGIVLQQTSIHTVKEIKGNKLQIEIELTQSAEEQEMQAPGLPPGTALTLKSLESTGTGAMLLDPAELFPISKMKSNSKMEMEMDAGELVQPMQTEVSLEMSIAPPTEASSSKGK